MQQRTQLLLFSSLALSGLLIAIYFKRKPAAPPPAPVANRDVFTVEDQSASRPEQLLGPPTQATGLRTTPAVATNVAPSSSSLVSLRIQEKDLEHLINVEVSNSDWTNLGLQTIGSVLQSYHWSMREGQLITWFNCMSPLQRFAWENIMRAHPENVEQTARALAAVTKFRIESIVQTGESTCVVNLAQKTTQEKSFNEQISLLKTSAGWLVDGESGYLNRSYHVGSLGPLLRQGIIMRPEPPKEIRGFKELN